MVAHQTGYGFAIIDVSTLLGKELPPKDGSSRRIAHAFQPLAKFRINVYIYNRL